MTYKGQERRRCVRIDGNFIVSYRPLGSDNKIDISQTKNLSLGGMIFTSNQLFERGTKLLLEIRLPSDPNHPVPLTGQVIESTESIEGVVYNTRLEFIAVDDKEKALINKVIEVFVKRQK